MSLGRLDIIFPVLPPTIDGIGDHTALLAEAMSSVFDVRVLTAQPDWAPVDQVDVVQAFDLTRRKGILRAFEAISSNPPDWVFLQFNQYSYGRWGVNPYLPLLLRRLRRLPRPPRIAWMAHEDFIPIRNFKSLVFGLIQRAQFFALGRSADLVLTTIEPWIERFETWFPRSTMAVLPVGANIPTATTDRRVARSALGISDDHFVVGYFGSTRVDRRITAVCQMVSALREDGHNAILLYVGADGTRVRELLAAELVIDAGTLDAQHVANTLVASDLYAAPYIDGVSGRRGGFLAGLKLGLPCLSNVGSQTDARMVPLNGSAYLLARDTTDASFVQAGRQLANDGDLRTRIADRGVTYYEQNHDWSAIAARLEKLLTGNRTAANDTPVEVLS